MVEAELLTGTETSDMNKKYQQSVVFNTKPRHQLTSQMVTLLASEDTVGERELILEVTAGAGGQEAMLFVAELFDMYAKLAARNGWSFDVTASDSSDLGVHSCDQTKIILYGKMQKILWFLFRAHFLHHR